MSYHLLYESCPWHSRAALFDDRGRLISLRIEEASDPYVEGAVVWARVRKIEKSLGGAFVDIGDHNDGFLPLNTLPHDLRKLTEGQNLLVRVTRAGYADKGARLDARVAIKPPSATTQAPKLISPAPSALTRALHDAGAHPVTCWIPDARLRDTAAMHFADNAIKQIDQDERGLDWCERLDTELDAMLSPLPTWQFAAGSIIVEITNAVCAIDINAKPTAHGNHNRDEVILAANFAAASEVARLCKLLDLGGSIVIDFITPRMREHRQAVTDHLSAAFATSDEGFIEVRAMSRHGLLELTRSRSGPSLILLMKEPAYVAGRILLELWRTPAGRNPRLKNRSVICPPIVAGLLSQRLTNENCLKNLGLPISVKSDGSLFSATYRMSDGL